MKKCLVISPHLDDAILSAGQFIAGRPGCDVLTVFSGIPQISAKYLTAYDKSCGFKTSKDAMVIRRQEDEEACAILNANPIHLDFLDSQYGAHERDGLVDVLDHFKLSDYEMIIGPLGLRHPDHIAVSDALKKLNPPNLYLYVYEELPARVTHPELVVERLKEFPSAELVFIGDGPIQDKIRALFCYRSQIGRGDLNTYNLYVPERFWKV